MIEIPDAGATGREQVRKSGSAVTANRPQTDGSGTLDAGVRILQEAREPRKRKRGVAWTHASPPGHIPDSLDALTTGPGVRARGRRCHEFGGVARIVKLPLPIRQFETNLDVVWSMEQPPTAIGTVDRVDDLDEDTQTGQRDQDEKGRKRNEREHAAWLPHVRDETAKTCRPVDDGPATHRKGCQGERHRDQHEFDDDHGCHHEPFGCPLHTDSSEQACKMVLRSRRRGAGSCSWTCPRPCTAVAIPACPWPVNPPYQSTYCDFASTSPDTPTRSTSTRWAPRGSGGRSNTRT